MFIAGCLALAGGGGIRQDLFSRSTEVGRPAKVVPSASKDLHLCCMKILQTR